MTRPIPEALFSCSNQYCAEETTYPAEMLYWYEQECRWVCDNCWDDLPPLNEECDMPEKGETLQDYLDRHNVQRAEILKGRPKQP
jgi:hypothetical protein